MFVFRRHIELCLNCGIFRVLLVRKAQWGEEEGNEKREKEKRGEKEGKRKGENNLPQSYVIFTLIQYDSKRELFKSTVP